MNRSNTPAGILEQERNGLFEERRERRRSKNASTNATASEAAEIQQSLSRTQKLLQSELSRVAAVQNAIDDDDKLIRKTLDTHKTLNVAGVKKALTALERAKQKERRILGAAVFFFWSSVFFVMWCRIIVRIPFADQVVALVPVVFNFLSELFGKALEQTAQATSIAVAKSRHVIESARETIEDLIE